MEIFRISRDVWGREVLGGISWDLLGVAVAAGATVIAVHAVYRVVRRRRN